MLSCLLPDPTITVFDEIIVGSQGETITCHVSSTQTVVECPVCMQPTSSIHSRYQRNPVDLPWAGISVRLRLHVRRFWCRNPTCGRRIFCERLPTVAAPWSRRTQRLAEAQRAIGLANGGASGARLCVALAMDAGIDLLLSLVRREPPIEPGTPRVLGVDDWAIRKGQTYGTILVDLERSTIIDVLPDRTAAGLAQWLAAHPGVEIVSRDRAGAYADGIRQGAPDAIQVADRWHLLKNLADAVYKVLQKYQTTIERTIASELSPTDGQAIPLGLVSPSQPVPLGGHLSAADVARQARIAETQRLHRDGWTTTAIATHLGLCPKTVRRYRSTELPLAPLRRFGRKRLLEAYEPWILQRWNAGCRNATQLFREIQAQGFTGQATIVRNFVRQLRAASGLPPRVRSHNGTPMVQNPAVRRPTLRTLACLITQPPEKVDENDRKVIQTVSDINPKIKLAIELAQVFAAMLRQRQIELLDGWLDRARHSLLNSFATGLLRDIDAVKAALSLPWSNGPTEGHINRLKCLKRQMYGRAKLDLLRHRLLAA